MTYIHNINPVLITIGPLNLYWYGAMYAISFILIDYMMKQQANEHDDSFNLVILDKILLISLISLILGGRLGYVLFYNMEYYLLNLNRVLFIWEGGMSFHGALLGVLIGLLYISKTENISFLKISDLVVLYIPIGLFFGRIGNFINSELYGHPTDSDYGVIFPIIDNIPRHPSMLYEAFLEGIVLYIVLRFMYKKRLDTGILTSLFLTLYALFRFIVEFVRVPDVHIGYLYSTWLTMGMILSFPMFIFGIMIYYFSIKRKE
tara:strand:+ start:961 stop:1743 length:783 start_codon:yes stop_codon:yes gene_type:complete